MSARQPTRPVEERFWSKVERGAPNECWEWTAKRGSQGYGYFSRGSRIQGTVYAHRFAYELVIGPVPDGMDIHHRCGNPSCCNPTHLEPLPRRKHMLLTMPTLAAKVAQTHCIHGHPLSGDNLYIRPDRGTRVCRECQNRWLARKRASEPSR